MNGTYTIDSARAPLLQTPFGIKNGQFKTKNYKRTRNISTHMREYIRGHENQNATRNKILKRSRWYVKTHGAPSPDTQEHKMGEYLQELDETAYQCTTCQLRYVEKRKNEKPKLPTQCGTQLSPEDKTAALRPNETVTNSPVREKN